MGRQPQPQIRQRLLDACTDYALDHGLPDRLAPLAAAAGTSSRMLIYHFETRVGLLREVLGQARQRQVEAFTDLIRLRPDEPDTVTLAGAWPAISGPQGEPYLRMLGRLHDTAGEPLWPGFRRTATTDWLAPLEDGMRSLGRPELATVVLAVIRGLLMDLDATGDATRTHRAFTDFLTTIQGAGPARWTRSVRPGAVAPPGGDHALAHDVAREPGQLAQLAQARAAPARRCAADVEGERAHPSGVAPRRPRHGHRQQRQGHADRGERVVDEHPPAVGNAGAPAHEVGAGGPEAVRTVDEQQVDRPVERPQRERREVADVADAVVDAGALEVRPEGREVCLA